MWSSRSRVVGGFADQKRQTPGWGSGTDHKYVASSPVHVHKENPDLPDCVEYHPGFLINDKQLFSTFTKDLEFKTRTVPAPNGTNYSLKRSTCAYGDANIMDAPPKIWGSDLTVKEWTPELLEIKTKIEALTGKYYNVCLCNLYETGRNSIGWHADNEEIGSLSSIASISLGAARIFQLKKKGTEDIIEQRLESGSLFLMKEGCQENYLHCVPTDPSCRERRINLTFRLFDVEQYSKR
jgi:hypothetical protein